MVLGPFAETKGPRRAGTKARINKFFSTKSESEHFAHTLCLTPPYPFASLSIREN
jgi:hypothetical protein